MQIIEVRQLDTDYTDTELLEFGQQLSRAERKTSQVKEDKKRAASDFAAELKNLESEIGDLSRRIEYKRGPKPIECRVDLNQPERGQKQIWRMDTGELVATETMTAAEIQRRFEFDNEAEKAPSFAGRMRAAKDANEGRVILRDLETAIAALERKADIEITTVGTNPHGYRGFTVVQAKEWRAVQKHIRDNGHREIAKEHEALIADGREAVELLDALKAEENARIWQRSTGGAEPEEDHAHAG